jgi:hypothetical protein
VAKQIEASRSKQPILRTQNKSRAPHPPRRKKRPKAAKRSCYQIARAQFNSSDVSVRGVLPNGRGAPVPGRSNVKSIKLTDFHSLFDLVRLGFPAFGFGQVTPPYSNVWVVLIDKTGMIAMNPNK